MRVRGSDNGDDEGEGGDNGDEGVTMVMPRVRERVTMAMPRMKVRGLG